MNEPKRKLLGGCRANPLVTIGRKPQSTRMGRDGKRVLDAALRVWEARQGLRFPSFWTRDRQ